MTISRSSNGTGTSASRGLFDAARYYLSGRRGVLAFAVIAALAGVGFSWNWLIAAGIAPVVLTVLPCLVMCGLGLCMNKLFGSSCASEPAQSNSTASVQPGATTSIVSLKSALPGRPGCRSAAMSTETASITSQPLDQRRDIHA
jgi:hypothetical protein